MNTEYAQLPDQDEFGQICCFCHGLGKRHLLLIRSKGFVRSDKLSDCRFCDGAGTHAAMIKNEYRIRVIGG